MDKHISLARELGYEGQELREYLKRQQDLERGGKVGPKGYMKKRKKRPSKKIKKREQKEKDREQER